MLSWLADRYFDGSREAVLAFLIIVSIVPALISIEWAFSQVLPDSCVNPTCDLSGPELMGTIEAIETAHPSDFDIQDILNER